jgi:uncharacterized sulfatase
MLRTNRRSFLGAGLAASMSRAQQPERPNILWITCEDTGPHIGTYGDPNANTPHLDRLAARGQVYDHAWSNAPVCAPARTTIISGMFPTSTGSEHMRSLARLPRDFHMYPVYLRQAGYYCTNNSKEDYNLAHTGKVWDESSSTAHWRKRAAGQPFFSIFNFTITHESQVRRRPHTLTHDPARVRVPAYHPDTPEVRHDWAQYHDNITTMDGLAGEVMQQLQADGLAESTIVFFYGDHGPGMPRSKRWPYNSGLHVPMILHVPERWKQLAPKGYRAGAHTQRLVSFVDLAPTALSLAGIQPPAHMQGTPFAGRFEGAEPEFLHGFRGRMDERYDMVRSVRDKRFVYIRNYMPHQIYGQYIEYMFQTPTTKVWKERYDAGTLNDAQKRFWETKPREELYDLRNDRDEVRNLAGDPAHKSTLERMRKAQRDHALKIRDVGFLPEDEIHKRAVGSSPYEVGHSPAYPLERIMAAADAPTPAAWSDTDSAVRYWAAMQAGAANEKDLVRALKDNAPGVRIMAAQSLGLHGKPEHLPDCLAVLEQYAPADTNGVYLSMLAMNAIGALGQKAATLRDKVAAMAKVDPKAEKKLSAYVPNLVEKFLADLR